MTPCVGVEPHARRRFGAGRAPARELPPRVRDCVLAQSLIQHRRVGRRTSGRVADHVLVPPQMFAMDFTVVAKGARLRCAIVGRFTVVGPGQDVGLGPGADPCRFHHVDPPGLVVIPRRGRREFQAVAEAP